MKEGGKEEPIKGQINRRKKNNYCYNFLILLIVILTNDYGRQVK